MSKFVDSIIGHAVGDAMGVPTQFCIREYLLKKPVVEMIGSKKTGQPEGSWSDDTSMEIATIDSFINKGSFDYSDIMNNWVKWISLAEYTPNNDTFDVGSTCLKAISNYRKHIDPFECGSDSEKECANGSLMRILPVALYSYYKRLSDEEVIKLTNDISSLTHKHDICKLGCYIYVRYIMFLLDGKDKYEAYNLIQKLDYSSYGEYAISKYKRILNDDISKYSMNEISSLGYVVDTLECAFWIFLKSNNYKETIISSTNIGNDTDTIGAIVGSMAGIIYGYNDIPEKWLNKLVENIGKSISSYGKKVSSTSQVGTTKNSIGNAINRFGTSIQTHTPSSVGKNLRLSGYTNIADAIRTMNPTKNVINRKYSGRK